jgi:hypothetical protein
MKYFLLLVGSAFSFSVNAQLTRDTVLNRCPIHITDTVSNNNFFIEQRPATLKVFRVKGDLTVVVEQRDQFFTLSFHDKRLKAGNYPIDKAAGGNREVEATYSFRSGDQVAYIEVYSGNVQVTYDKVTKIWKLKINGLIRNLVETTVSYYKVRAELNLKG